MNDVVTLAHGSGGKQTAELIDTVFKAHFSNPEFTADDAALLSVGGANLAFTTDGFIVSPPEFPGGNIGKLSICGTVNDLACMGAKPLYMTCAFVLEEGFPLAKVEAYAAAMAETAAEAGVRIVAGDTKVAGKGQVDGLFITTTGIGLATEGVHLSGAQARPGDAVIVSGDIGRHGCTILLARSQFGIDADVTSDCAPLWGTVQSMLETTKDIHVIRDATRGGVGTVLHEIAAQSGVGIRRAQPRARVDQSRIDRADSPDAVGRPTVQAAGQRQYADLMPLALQGAAQRQHAGDHAVDGGDVPIGCQQDLHRRSLISCHLANCAAPNLAARLQPLYLLERGSRAFFGRFTKFSPRFYSTTQKFRKGSENGKKSKN